MASGIGCSVNSKKLNSYCFCKITMEAEIWQSLPEELLFMILARLPIRVLGKMRTVCRQWNYLLSSRDALQQIAPNWSLHSTPGFLLQIEWDRDDGCWVIEGHGSGIYKVARAYPFFNIIVKNSCKSISCCHIKGDILPLCIGIPGTMNWRELPRLSRRPRYNFNGMAFDSSTRRCILLLGSVTIIRPRTSLMCIYDSESNAWTTFFTKLPNQIQPCGRAIYSQGKFYWADSSSNLIVARNNATGVWTKFPLPEGCSNIRPENLSGYDGQVMLLQHKEVDCVRIWKLNGAENFEMWCELRSSVLTKGLCPLFPLVTVNSSGLIMVIDWKMNMSIFNSEGKSIVQEMRLPGIRTSERPPISGFGSAFESNNVWWP